MKLFQKAAGVYRSTLIKLLKHTPVCEGHHNSQENNKSGKIQNAM